MTHPLMNSAPAWRAAGRRSIAIDTDPRDLPASAAALLEARVDVMVGHRTLPNLPCR